MAGGHPTDYRKEYCERVIELGKQGFSYAEMAADIGISKQTLYNWRDAHEEFFDALNIARTNSQAWWENVGRNALFADKFQSGVYNKRISCMFADDYTEKQAVDLASSDGSMSPTDSARDAVLAAIKQKHEAKTNS